MASNHYRSRSWLIFAPCLITLLILVTFFVFKFSAKPEVQSAKTAIPETIPIIKPIKTENYRGLPVRLKIPAIGVDTAVEYMGDTTGGDMAVPSNLVNVGWYKYGSIPGETGSAVIAGHVVGFKDEPGVFKKLDKLKTGDILLVVDAKGQSASFTVRGTKTYDPKQQHDEVFNSVSGAHLNLITCAGDWDSSHQHYLKRLVVFADSSPGV
jgi:LPXTG-site transpeptidase (sortase) family protein